MKDLPVFLDTEEEARASIEGNGATGRGTRLKVPRLLCDMPDEVACTKASVKARCAAMKEFKTKREHNIYEDGPFCHFMCIPKKGSPCYLQKLF